MTNVKINHPKEAVKRPTKHELEAGQYYLDINVLSDHEIYIVVECEKGPTLVDIHTGYLYAMEGDGMCGDDADFVLLSDIEISYTR